MGLTKRMQQIADLVTPGLVVADIGCDHAFLPIDLVSRGICPSALAMDVNKGPLERAKAHVKEAQLEDRIELRLSDGMTKLKPGEAECAILAGMGGKLICRILNDAPETLSTLKELVLSPHADVREVRLFLDAHGFRIVQEAFLLEEGKYYTVIKAQKELRPQAHADAPMSVETAASEADAKTQIHHLTEAELRFGPCILRERPPVFLTFLQKEEAQKQGILKTLQDAVQNAEETEALQNREAAQNTEKTKAVQSEASAADPGKIPERIRELEADLQLIRMLLEKG